MRRRQTKGNRKKHKDLLAEAMKQPGVKAIMDVFETADKYARQSAEVANYIDWQRFPHSVSSCNTTHLAG